MQQILFIPCGTKPVDDAWLLRVIWNDVFGSLLLIFSRRSDARLPWRIPFSYGTDQFCYGRLRSTQENDSRHDVNFVVTDGTGVTSDDKSVIVKPLGFHWTLVSASR